MAYWLVKDEPESWSYQKHAAEGVASWDGVRNHQAANNLKSMKKGDRVFFYHSVTEKRLAGILEVVRESYPDPTDKEGKWVAVDLRAVMPIEKQVTLADIKQEPRLKELALVRHSRLSVMPVRAEEWKLLCKMAGIAA
ncbi:MAG: EVE domain-containing protein [Rhodospirillaceae bacterium]|nr:EVE domain-containing protein [Rhodospirillaceae bacterium]